MKHFLAFLIPTLLLIINCKDSDNPVNPGNGGGGDKITTGDVVNLTTESIGIGGGTIKVSKPGDPLDKFEMIIPPNSFNQSANFQISYAPIVKHQFGENFNPISPMIKISCNESFSDHAIKIKIPIQLPANHFASGFFYSEETQTLEPVPSIELSDSTIILITNSLPSSKKLSKSTEDVKTNLIISSILESGIDNGAVLSTGFEPGYDDWEFQNSGSYAEPEGHCAGQSMSAVYYYYEKRLKENADHLYHKYDLINDKSTLPSKLWEDNPRGIRFASAMQRELIAGWTDLKTALEEQLSNPTIVWKLFIHGILVTGAPQNIFVEQSTPPNYAHNMIVYKANLSEKKLYIADPNFPTLVKTITYQAGKLGPYNTKTKHGEPEMVFDLIGFMGVSALVNWSKFKEKWNQFEAGTIGNDIFPSYKLYVDNTSGLEITDGMTVTNPTLKIVCKSDKCESFIGSTDKLQPIEIFDEGGSIIAFGNLSDKGVATVLPKLGANKIGIYIKGLKSDGKEYYVDFKWITINFSPTTQPKLVITPNPLNGLKNKKYRFTATLEGATLPAKPRYFWGLDAHGTSKIVYNDNTLEYKYIDTGTYPIQVSLSDSVTGNSIAYGSSQAIIREAANNYEYLITSWLLSFSLNASMTFNPSDAGNAISHEFKISTDYFFLGGRDDLTWNENSFSMAYNYERLLYINEKNDTAKLFVNGSFEGIISTDGQILTSFEADEHQKDDSGYVKDQSITIANVPINNCSSNGCGAVHEGPQVKSYITNISISGSYKDSQTSQIINYSLVSIDYNSANKPRLSISFVR